MKLVEVKYVGRKAMAFDNVARSGKSWNGAGDVQSVTEAQAKELCKYPDQWVLNDLADAARISAPSNITVTDTDGTTVTVDPDVFKRPLEKMTKPELRAYAKDTFGKELDGRLSAKSMIDQIEEWEATLNKITGEQVFDSPV